MGLSQITDRWHFLSEHAGIISLDPVEPRQLKRFPVFAGLEFETLDRIAPDITLARWHDGAFLFEEGAYIDLAFIIVNGRVRLLSSLHRQPVAGRSLSFLAMLGMEEAAGITRLTLEKNDVLGEIGAVNGWPQPFAAQVVGETELLQIRQPALRLLRRKAGAFHLRLEQEYRRQMLVACLKRNPIFARLDDLTLLNLAVSAELLSLEPGETLVEENTEAECVFIVAGGFLRIGKTTADDAITVNYLRPGDIFGAMEFVNNMPGYHYSAAAVEFLDVIRLPFPALQEAIVADFTILSNLTLYSKEFAERCRLNTADPEKIGRLETALSFGLIEGASVLRIDLDRCTRCDDCVRGCADTHGGLPRFVREGERDGNWLIPKSCYHCQDPLCLIGCPTGAISRRSSRGIVKIDENLCVGCKACAKNCPYDAIVMHDNGELWTKENAPAASMVAKPRLVASKCDQCEGLPHGPACVLACPVGCAERVDSR